MAKGKGQICPGCAKQTFHDRGSHRRCSSCEYIGWSWRQSVEQVGKGRGKRCPNCSWLTLHEILVLDNGNGCTVRRCSTCDFSGIEPPKQKQ